MKDDVRLAEQPRGAQREEIGGAGASTDEIDRSSHCTMPAATVRLVASSIKMNAPVARTAW